MSARASAAEVSALQARVAEYVRGVAANQAAAPTPAAPPPKDAGAKLDALRTTISCALASLSMATEIVAVLPEESLGLSAGATLSALGVASEEVRMVHEAISRASGVANHDANSCAMSASEENSPRGRSRSPARGGRRRGVAAADVEAADAEVANHEASEAARKAMEDAPALAPGQTYAWEIHPSYMEDRCPDWDMWDARGRWVGPIN